MLGSLEISSTGLIHLLHLISVFFLKLSGHAQNVDKFSANITHIVWSPIASGVFVPNWNLLSLVSTACISISILVSLALNRISNQAQFTTFLGYFSSPHPLTFANSSHKPIPKTSEPRSQVRSSNNPTALVPKSVWITVLIITREVWGEFIRQRF